MSHWIRCWLLLFLCASVSADDRVLLTAENPAADVLPTLGVWEDYSEKNDQYYRYVSASFPRVPGFTTDMWCYESPGITYAAARELDGGCVQMRHTWEESSWDILTTVSPRADGLELVARMERKPDEPVTEARLIEYPSLNVCWQLQRAAGFASEPDPYPQFVERCFIFTESGRTFLLDTERRPIPVKSVEHKRNNPPWVQMYLPKTARDRRAGPQGWADYSPDRYVHQLIGAVSRDGKYLTALGCGAESILSQAWHDCMHNNAKWLPSANGPGKEWRIRLYVMQNDPDELIRRFQRDFPHVVPSGE